MKKLTALKSNAKSATLRLINQRGAAALDLRVKQGETPMKLNSGVKVNRLNADEVDGKSAGEIGVNGIEIIRDTSAFNSDSDKTAIASCPAGKVVVGTGADISGGKSGVFPNTETDVVIDGITPSSTEVHVTAYEEEPTSANWNVSARAICATAP